MKLIGFVVSYLPVNIAKQSKLLVQGGEAGVRRISLLPAGCCWAGSLLIIVLALSIVLQQQSKEKGGNATVQPPPSILEHHTPRSKHTLSKK